MMSLTSKQVARPRSWVCAWAARIAAALAAVSAINGAVAGDLDQTGTLWAPYLEWSLDNPTFTGNPFDLIATVTFEHQGTGETRTTEMFHDGGITWKFRFTGTRIGAWIFATSSDDPELDGLNGTVTIDANPNLDAYGFMVHYEVTDGTKWARLKGNNLEIEAFVPQLVMYEGDPREYYDDPARIQADIQEFMTGHGFNGFHVPTVAGRWFDIDAEPAVNTSMTDPDPQTFEALELLIAETHAAGGVVHIWAWGDDTRAQTPIRLAGGIGGAEDLRLQRYIAARLGPLPGWSMGYGFDLDEWVPTGVEVHEWRDYVHEHLGWFHYFGGRPLGPNSGTDHSPWIGWNEPLDYSSYEHHEPGYDVYVAAIENVPGQPVMSEDRFRIRGFNGPGKDYTMEQTRRGLWISTMAGGVANIWGNLTNPDGSHISGGPSLPYPNPEWIKTYSVFFIDNGRFDKELLRANDLTDGFALRLPDDTRFIFYKEDTASIQVDLSAMPGPQPAVAVDAMQTYQELDLGLLDPTIQTITLPETSDWAIAVGYFGGGVLSFTDIWGDLPTTTGGHGAMFADADGDDLPDAYLPLIWTGTKPDLFLYNQGGGSFAEEGTLRGIDDVDGGSHGAAWADLDNDGDYDLINGTTFEPENQNDVFENDGAGFFTEVAPPDIEARQEATRAFIAFDMDGDGDLDLFGVTNYQGSSDPPEERNEVYRNDGNFQFAEVTLGNLYTAPAGQGATDTDYDGDGDIDVIAANRTGPVNILQNDGSGDFTLIIPSSIGLPDTAGVAGDGITTADVDNDGDLDMLLAQDEAGELYLNDGDGTFTFQQSFSATGGYMGGFADLDNDGDLDLVFAGDDLVYLNDGAGSFAAGPSVPVDVDDPRGIGFADIDNDGDVDFAIGAKRSRSTLIRNNFDAGNWLKIKLISVQGQAGAFGAKARIFAAGNLGGQLLGLRESRSNRGYLGQDDPVLHFGLGLETAVDVEVTFLGGTTMTLLDVIANQTITADGRLADDTPPPAPTNLEAVAISQSRIDLAWDEAEDPESGISEYKIYRDGEPVDVVPGSQTSYSDTGLDELTEYTYQVSAVNGAGLEGPLSQPAGATTLADTTPPTIESAEAVTQTTVIVVFSEPVEETSAETVTNYAIDHGIQVADAVLQADTITVVLTTSTLSPGITYTLTVNNVEDRSVAGNPIAPDSQIQFALPARVTDGLVVLYDFEEGEGTVVHDVSDVGDSLDLTLADPDAGEWVEGGLLITSNTIVQSAGAATKIIDACMASNEITIEAWIAPANTTQSGPARIVTLSPNTSVRDFTLGQVAANYDVRFRTTETSMQGHPSLSTADDPLTTELTHVVYTRAASGEVKIYIDTIEKASGVRGGDLSNWDTSYGFALANELTLDRTWLGEFRLVAIYERALEPEEVTRNFDAGPDGPGLPGDLDGDGDVDIDDFAIFAGCLTGPEVSAAPECTTADFDGDSDVDLADFGKFMLAYGGA